MRRAGIALGSNLGDRLAHLHAAMDQLRKISLPGEPVLAAPIYQTEPRFCPPGSPDFYNTVIEIAYAGTALELLEKTSAIEETLGRIRQTARNAPRVIDIDLLYLGEQTHAGAHLTLPHPRIGERRFVLQPLAGIRPSLTLPGYKQTIAEMLTNLQSDEPPLVLVQQPASRP